MILISVDSAQYTTTQGLINLAVTANLDDGKGVVPLAYAWAVGDPNGLGPQVDTYMAAHPGFPISAAPAPTGGAVDLERDRRRNLVLAVTTSPTGAFQVNMDDTAQANIQGLATAGLYLSSAAPTQPTPFRDYANVTHNLLPSELVSMGLQVMSHISTLYQKSWALKAMNPVPANYTDDGYWS